mmetsp:Transcript_69877/g.227440  ORF Transcript_69877/g.227440 Transcript_69877/m.227440 type:complete len:642 (+) Transcript_69877:64-1989(+)|eukprot:CAMPEP_0203951106 /NCGR_PEP_ID=MMETSP0359-20131031/85089_1 /ASSEMBLY_ACC=CAM_ASM_000338 /TAXON_ID=268821 /ORGANISM="Scrippsiella Hangoei, Strain SHTV-5" /LENGTH=641 /DNA_ID=CAMNT_0050883595 /DNA_START=49 /DNA_END=1974 /DNA_ORIENTATION=-
MASPDPPHELGAGLASAARESTRHFATLPGSDEWTVATSAGRVRGAALHGGGAFLGLPFARPPVGVRRWARPEEAEPWEGILECTSFGPVCPQGQVPGTGSKAIPVPADWAALLKPESKVEGALPPGMDEDCLQLNLYTPGLEGKFPTMVWFHGGNLTGGSSCDNLVFDPSAHHGSNPAFLSQKHKLVVVSAAYRLNVFGFLNLEGGDGNCGLLDAAAALRWVQREIDKFGGDPSNVTVFGLSAGGHITSQLLSMPAADGLFQKAICMSGSAQWSMGNQDDHNRRVAEPFAKRLGFESLQEMTIEQARDLSAETLRQAYLKSRDFLESGTLSVDGSSVPSDPLDLMYSGCARQIKVMSGVTRDEGVFSTMLKRKTSTIQDVIQDVKTHLKSTCYLMVGDFDALRDIPDEICQQVAEGLVEDYQDLVTRYREAPEEVRRRFVDLGTEKCRDIAEINYELAAKILGDHDFLISHVMATWALSRHADVYAYVFSDGVVPGKRFAGHGADQNFLFGTPSPRAPAEGSEAAVELSDRIMEAWAAFAKSGDPITETLGEWPPILFPNNSEDGAEVQPLPADPAARMLHMNFEHDRVGLVSHGWEETGIWFKHILKLRDRLESSGSSFQVHPVLATMAASMYSALTPA